jgi:hypothetical protein
MEQWDTHGLNGIGGHDNVAVHLVVGREMEVCSLARDVVIAASQFRHVV